MKKSQAEIRQELKRIREDNTLTEDEKRKLSQNVMQEIVKPPTELVSNLSKECSHYQKKCSRFVFDCCNVTDPCNRCHLARECCKTVPPMISSITCDECETTQTPSPTCVQCATQFSKSYCSICKLWTALDIFHCKDCGFCRVGKAEEMYHCRTCNACYHVKSRGVHVCARVALTHEKCAYCLESVHTSQKSSTLAGCCGTTLHNECMMSAAKHGNYRCPRCRKSCYDMENVWRELRISIAAQPLPPEMFEFAKDIIFRSSYGPFKITAEANEEDSESGEGRSDSNSLYAGELVEWILSDGTTAKATLNASAMINKVRMMWVWCNDCEKKSLVDFHFLGLECKHCKGFNTSQA